MTVNSLVARLHIFKDELPVYVLAEKIRYPCGKLLRKDRTILLYSSLPALTVGKIKDELAGMSDGFDTVRYYVSPSISMGIDRAIGDGNQILIYCKTGMESSHKESSSLSQPVEQDANPASKESPSPSQVVVDFGSGIKGRVCMPDGEWGFAVLDDNNDWIAQIDPDALDAPTRELVESLLKAQEEGKC